VLLQNSHGDFSSKQNTLFLYQKFKIVISDDQDCVISDDRSHAFASPVDMDSYWSTDAIKQADIFCLDDLGQFDNFSKQGCFKKFPYPDHDLAMIVAGQQKGRKNDKERTIGLNIGMALDDVAVAPLIYAAAIKKQIGTELPL